MLIFKNGIDRVPGKGILHIIVMRIVPDKCIPGRQLIDSSCLCTQPEYTLFIINSIDKITVQSVSVC